MFLAEGFLMSISIRIIETNSELALGINKAAADYFNKLMKKKTTRITNDIKRLVPKWITEQPEMTSLAQQGVPGSLNAQFGLYRGTGDSAVTAIADAVRESVIVKLEKVDQNLSGGLTIGIQPETFANLLGLSEGFVKTAEYSLHWLDWLLLQGDRTIVSGYKYVPSNEGRGGGGTMVGGGSWRVSPQYSGRADDNFVTRALNGRDREIQEVIERAFK
jgi:hypothetical protein